MQRRTLLASALLAAACAAPAFAQAPFPSKPVTIVVPNAPGGAIDILARLLERHLSESWKQPVVVQYKPGAGTVLGTDFVAKSTPDGHTIGLIVTSHVINPSLRKNMPFDTLKDVSGVTMLATSPIVIAATPSLPANNIKELIALAKQQPGKLTYASPGSGSSMHLGAELLKTQGSSAMKSSNASAASLHSSAAPPHSAPALKPICFSRALPGNACSVGDCVLAARCDL